MHRSRLSVLVIFAAVAACSTNDDSQGTDILAQDRTLIARLEVDQETGQQSLPDACGTVALAAQPALVGQQQAKELTRQARDAEMQGDVQEARALLRRASELDGTNKSTAYHLGRTNEALGDGEGAMTAYCRYLALTPTTAEQVEARQRVTALSRSQTALARSQQRVAAAPVGVGAPVRQSAQAAPVVRRMARERPTARPRVVASAPVQRSAPVRPTERDAGPASTTSNETATTQEAGDVPVVATAGGDVVETAGPAPAVDRPATAPRTASRGPSRTQSAIIGAATGGIIGAATGRSVKGAVIGAAAGGILGTVVGGRINPIGRSIRPYASGS